ncbi:MAG: hypothetical protein PHD00_09340 [Bacteroidales bacterium]|jgi:hypothetical protein|nr:hypothetical protein [Bacteroidales bacterium]MDD4672814.1 hypothetical protein [Bacteroidales bacterium]MDY0349349.1 hypothetical protein [Tenuifilaceae bacterium]
MAHWHFIAYQKDLFIEQKKLYTRQENLEYVNPANAESAWQVSK